MIEQIVSATGFTVVQVLVAGPFTAFAASEQTVSATASTAATPYIYKAHFFQVDTIFPLAQSLQKSLIA
jgi:hypothetical protein